MATRLSWWLGGAALGCALIAGAYLPPRGSMNGVGRYLGMFSMWKEPVTSPAKERANKLLSQLSQVDGRLQASWFRRKAEPELQARRVRGEQGPLLIVAPDSAYDRKFAAAQLALDSAWRQLDLRDPKVDVLVAIPGPSVRGYRRATGTLYTSSRTYLLPDSTDRTTCIAVLPMYWKEGTSSFQRTERESWMRGSLGPCAFYAKFGVPGPRVRRWLDANRFDVAEVSEWSRVRTRDYDDYEEMRSRYGTAWWALSLYDMPFNTLACLSGRLTACTTALKRGDTEDGGPFERVVIPAWGWRTSDARIVRRETFLAAVYHQVGDNAFQDFWTTTLPVDSALTVALGVPAAKWSQQWQLRGDPVPRLGAAPPLSAALLAILIALLSLAAAAYATRWRQVQ